MGRRLNISTPTVIQTELIPLDESFYIEEQGQVEQWYYDNTNQYAPNRTISPLTLVPHVSCFDGDTQTTYTPSFYITRWYEKYYDATLGDYTEREITNIQDSSTADYVKVGNNLLVKKNVPYTHSITIRCEATYIDPRDSGVTYVTGDTVLLTTNRDAKTVYPQLDILCPSSQSYNPLVDAQSRFEMKATADYSAVVKSDVLEYGVDSLGTEEIAPNNDDTLVNAAPVMDIRYGDLVEYDQQFMRRITSDQQTFSIDGNKAFLQKVVGNTVAWNQLVQNGDFANGTTGWGGNGISTSVSNNIVTCTVTGAGFARLQQYINFISGHKYLLSCRFKASITGGTFNLGVGYVSAASVQSAAFTENTTGDWEQLKGIVSANNNYDYLKINLMQGFANGDSAQITNVYSLDLTLIYGAGNEPSTVAEFETWLATNIGVKGYYPYTAGKLVNFGGYGVKMNQLMNNTSNTTLFHMDFPQGQSSTGTIVLTSGIQGIQNHVYYYRWAPTENNTISEIYANMTNPWTNRDLTYSRRSYLITNAQGGNHQFIKYGEVEVGGVFEAYLNIIDLTLMFGAGNEPTLEECNAIFTKDYYPYNTGTSMNILDVMGKEVGMKTTGFNQWDEEAELGGYNVSNGEPVVLTDRLRTKNPIRVFPETSYYAKYGVVRSAWFYDINDDFISFVLTPSTNIINTPSNCYYLRFVLETGYGTTYNHDICINIIDPAKDGTYEAHWERFAKFDVTKITGINSVTHQREVMFPDGMKKAGASVFDSIYVNGGKIEAKKMCGDVDMSSLEWTATGSAGHLLVSNVINPTIKYIDASTPIKGCCSNRQIIAENGAWGTDKISGTGGSHVYVYVENNASYNPITGMLVYELETPVIYTDLKYEDGSDVAFPFTYEWYGIDNDSEVLADTLPWYVEGQDTDKITVDAMYGEDIRVLLRARDTNGNLIPPRVYRSIHWRTPDIDSNVACKNGSAVRSDSEDMTFETIINVKGAVLDDNKKNSHLRFNWKTRKNNVSTEVDKGWGLTKTLHADELMNVIGQSSSLASTLVFPYVYLRGAYEKVTYNGSEVTDDGAVVFDRPVTD